MKFILILFFITINVSVFSQKPKPQLPPINWQLMDQQQDGYPGISVEKAYKELLSKKKPLKKIIVAIIDDGLDDKHPDLAGMRWTNKKEIPGNGIDDDHNGYIDDIHGWNFIGDNKHETYEEVREYVRLRARFENVRDTIKLKTDPQYAYWKRVTEAKNDRIRAIQNMLNMQQKILLSFEALASYYGTILPADSVNVAAFKYHSVNTADSALVKARGYLLSFSGSVQATPDSTLLSSVIKRIKPRLADVTSDLSDVNTVIRQNDPAYFRKKVLGDDPYINEHKIYGNANTYPDYTHGTECAGVIAALRNNGIGGNGITNYVEIMPLRIVASGNADEWDKDVSSAIRYATDNGAQVISMSFGKYFSPQRQWVNDAVKYAGHKGVLLVRAAMNDATNTDTIATYPQEYYSSQDNAANLITVGASTYDTTLVAGFSNYGSKTVDVFAPGVSIYMPLLNGDYNRAQGTSFACPLVAGLAAFVWSYYPQFSYLQVRQCIESSVKPISIVVTKPGTKQKVPFSTLSRAGGIVNAYYALKMADEIARTK